MIRNRSFMFGLGTGLIAGALLLQVMISGGAVPMTKETLIKEAAKLNLTVTDPAAEPQKTAAPAEEGTAPESQTGGTETPAADQATPAPSQTPAASPAAAVQPSAAVAPVSPSAPAKPKPSAGTASAPITPATPQPAVSGTVPVRIPAGSTLTETARLLAKAGVIGDQNEFLQTAISRKINTKIRSGSYQFAKGESIDSIITKLITVK
ncbi:YceG-like family protein [compost metagenome]